MPRLSALSNAMPHATSDIDAATFTAICLASCKRLPAMRRTAEAQRLDHLVEAGAWTDAALALIALELPNWQLRRLTFDEGEWYCALSQERNMPDWLDDAIETHHADMATAILDASLRDHSRWHITSRDRACQHDPAHRFHAHALRELLLSECLSAMLRAYSCQQSRSKM